MVASKQRLGRRDYTQKKRTKRAVDLNRLQVNTADKASYKRVKLIVTLTAHAADGLVASNTMEARNAQYTVSCFFHTDCDKSTSSS